MAAPRPRICQYPMVAAVVVLLIASARFAFILVAEASFVLFCRKRKVNAFRICFYLFFPRGLRSVSKIFSSLHSRVLPHTHIRFTCASTPRRRPVFVKCSAAKHRPNCLCCVGQPDPTLKKAIEKFETIVNNNNTNTNKTPKRSSKSGREEEESRGSKNAVVCESESISGINQTVAESFGSHVSQQRKRQNTLNGKSTEGAMRV